MPFQQPYNLGYIRTKPGILKAISLAIGFLAMLFTVGAFYYATYYNFDCEDIKDLGNGFNGRAGYLISFQQNRGFKVSLEEIEQARRNAPKIGSCEENYRNNEENCAYQLKLWDYWVSFANGHGGNEDDAKYFSGRSEPPASSCPSKYMVVLPMAIIIVTWSLGFIMLIVLLTVDLYKKLKQFIKIDFIGHIIATVLLTFSTVMLVGFLIWAFTSNYPCSQDDYDRGFYRGQLYETEARLGKSRTSDPKVTTKSRIFQTCLEHKEAVYKIWPLMVATFLTATTTALFGILTLTIVNKQGHVEPSLARQILEAKKQQDINGHSEEVIMSPSQGSFQSNDMFSFQDGQ